MNDFESYTFKRKKGVDDLLEVWAWTGNSQGDESYSNNIGEGEASMGWMSYRFKEIDRTDQEAINQEHERRKRYNEQYIEALKARGEYLQEYELNIHVKPNPLFDSKPQTSGGYRSLGLFIPL